MEAPTIQLAENTFTFFNRVKSNIDFLTSRNDRVFNQEDFSKWVNDTFELLRNMLSNEVIVDTINITTAQDGTYGVKDAYDLLNQELSYYNKTYNFISSTNANIQENSLDAADTAVDSIKELFDKLPKRIQKILTVLKEILGITKVII